MVAGLDKFKDHFKWYPEQYTLIGGAACFLNYDDAGIADDFRVTKDLDIVLSLESKKEEFFTKMWEFIQNGRYEVSELSSGKKTFYRFDNPENEGFPKMIELFSPIDALSFYDKKPGDIIPLKSEEISNLSAILLDDVFYDFIKSGKIIKNNLSYLKSTHLIPLKIRAFLDLNEKKAASNDIKKHRNDVFRLYRILDPQDKVSLPDIMAEDMKKFIDEITEIQDKINLNNFGYSNNWSISEFCTELKSFYGL
jgi:hypothetical protein